MSHIKTTVFNSQSSTLPSNIVALSEHESRGYCKFSKSLTFVQNARQEKWHIVHLVY